MSTKSRRSSPRPPPARPPAAGTAGAQPGGDGPEARDGRGPVAEAIEAPARRLAPGLHLVATPIGAARDITLRALDVLAGAEVLAAEDTRSLRRLMDLHAIPLAGRPLLAYHDRNGPEMRPRLLRLLDEGRSLAFAPEAGTPLVSDPGYQLVRAAVAAGHAVTAAPGPSAVLAALAVSGLPSDRFLFAGFPPAAAGARRRWIAELAAVPATMILFESPRRISRLLGELAPLWGEGREAAICRELTKRFEEVRRGTLGMLATTLQEEAERGVQLRGEVVLVVDRARRSGAPAGDGPEAGEGDAVQEGAGSMEAELKRRLAAMSVRQAVAEVVAATGLPRRTVYQAALRLAGAR